MPLYLLQFWVPPTIAIQPEASLCQPTFLLVSFLLEHLLAHILLRHSQHLLLQQLALIVLLQEHHLAAARWVRVCINKDSRSQNNYLLTCMLVSGALIRTQVFCRAAALPLQYCCCSR